MTYVPAVCVLLPVSVSVLPAWPSTSATAAPAGLLTTDALIVPEARALTNSSRVPLVAVRPPAVSRPPAVPPSTAAVCSRMPPLSRFSTFSGAANASVPPAMFTVRLLATFVPELNVPAAVSRTFEPLCTCPNVVA